MKFTTPCFIRKNTPELRQKLEEMGYEKHFLHLDEEPYLHTWAGVSSGIARYSSLPSGSVFVPDHSEYENAGCIDTDTNEALFLALAALREDSDYMQWFVYPEHDLWHLCREERLKHIYVEWEEGAADARTCFHKATPTELIEHFKNNE